MAGGRSNGCAGGFHGTLTAFVMSDCESHMWRIGSRKPDKYFLHRVIWELVGLMFGVILGATFSQVESRSEKMPEHRAARVATAERRVVFVPAGALAGFCLGGICAWLSVERSMRSAVAYFVVYVCLVYILMCALNM